ncbi:MAG: MFS transporter [Luteitalea sp.]|nr:MFS transporter [Luteitalea sp.]
MPTGFLAWRKDVTPDQWRAFFAAYLGWLLDGFDFTILTFLLVDISRSFTVSSALAGALGTVTLMFRLVGGIGAGVAADRWGRKGPLMFSILWYSLFAFFGGFSTSYTMLFICRALFGIGMGGVWAAGMPLAIEHWPPRLRGTVSGMLQSGYSTGFMLSALVYQFAYPIVSDEPDLGWRVMLWIGILPALLVLWIMARVRESPIWLARRHQPGASGQRGGLRRLFQRDLIGTTVHTSFVMAAFLCFYYSITFWYPTLLGQQQRGVLPYLVALNFGTMLGNVIWGPLSETRAGRRGAATIATTGGVLVVPLYLFAAGDLPLLVGALIMGIFGAGNFGVVPSYLNERFPTAVRAAGAGFAYHVGAAASSAMPFIVGWMQDRAMPLGSAMAVCIAATGTVLVMLIWLGPETRGRRLAE